MVGKCETSCAQAGIRGNPDIHGALRSAIHVFRSVVRGGERDVEVSLAGACAVTRSARAQSSYPDPANERACPSQIYGIPGVIDAAAAIQLLERSQPGHGYRR